MPENPRPSVSRREWLGLMTGGAVAASLAAAAGGLAELEPAPAGGERGIGVFNVRDYGARGNGLSLDTAAVQAAVDACHQAQGGTVLVPAGDFLVGTIKLKSDVTLRLAARGRLLGSARRGDYSEGNGVPRENGAMALVYASRANRVAIEGPGTIDGQGADFLRNRKAAGGGPRPHLVLFSDCTNVVVRDSFLTRSAFHCCRFLNCRFVRIDRIRIYNRGGSNNDGLHFNNAQFVHVSDSDVVCGDDACALFGSCQFVTVANCTFSTRWSIFRFGGGDARNIAVSNCVISETYGCPIKMACRAGSHYEDMVFSNLVLRGVTGPISLGLDPTDMSGGGGGGDLPRTVPAVPGDAVIRNIAFSGISGTIAARLRPYPDQPAGRGPSPGEIRQCIVLNGVHGGVLENISFSDVHLTFEGGGTAAEAARSVPQIAGEYFHIGTPPAYGLYARSVRGLTLDDVRFDTSGPDLRPAIVFESVTDASIRSLGARGNPGSSLARFSASRDVLITAPRVLGGAREFLQLDGTANENVAIDGGEFSGTAPFALENGAQLKSIRFRI